MVERIADGDFSPALLNVALLMLSGALPTLLLAFARQFLLARRTHPEFSLRKSEAAELDRAIILYRRARSRLDQLHDRSQKSKAVWHAIFAPPTPIDPDERDEREDLQAHSRHLCATIIRLRRLPLQRLRAWIRTLSLRSALGRAVAVQLAIFALLAASLHVSGQAASAQAGTLALGHSPVWYPFGQSLFQANASAACLAFVLLPGFYLFRSVRLRRQFSLEFCVLKELAAMPPDQRVDPAAAEIGMWQEAQPLADDPGESWFAILGVAPSASVDEVRDAYKALMKQNHPDRVQNLSPAIRRFAEAETKRINAAYEQALVCLN